MEKLHYSIQIEAPTRKVWEVLWSDETYPEWTRVFSEGSKVVTDWQEGSKVHFLDGTGAGMYSVIDRRVDNELMSFRHLGEVRGGLELPPDEKTKEWENAIEQYTLREWNGGTELVVEMDTTSGSAEHFDKTFPKALAEVKRLAED